MAKDVTGVQMLKLEEVIDEHLERCKEKLELRIVDRLETFLNEPSQNDAVFKAVIDLEVEKPRPLSNKRRQPPTLSRSYQKIQIDSCFEALQTKASVS